MTDKNKILEQKAKEWLSSLPWWKRIFTKINYNELYDNIIVTRVTKDGRICCIDFWLQQMKIFQYLSKKEDIDNVIKYFNFEDSFDIEKSNTIGGKRGQIRILQFVLKEKNNDPKL